jgi:mono/diheme cytochrome c family protein
MMTGTGRGLAAAALLATALLAAACERGDPHGAGEDLSFVRDLPVPAELRQGETLYNVHCATCHGPAGLGTDVGPPLVHIVYEPRHHADIAFYRAVAFGVRAHHWGFGDMPAIPDVTEEQVTEIIRYLRWLQRQAGIH